MESQRALQEWEQGRKGPEHAVRAYLTVIDRNPEAVEKALTNKP
jgi:putative transcriptional regulator